MEKDYAFVHWDQRGSGLSTGNPDLSTFTVDPYVVAWGTMNSYLSLATFFNGPYLAKRFNILELNLSEQMVKIKTPTMVIWGRHDGVNTIEIGFDAFNHIGGSGFTNKNMVILENSAHEGYIEEAELFKSTFKHFIDGL